MNWFKPKPRQPNQPGSEAEQPLVVTNAASQEAPFDLSNDDVVPPRETLVETSGVESEVEAHIDNPMETLAIDTEESETFVVESAAPLPSNNLPSHEPSGAAELQNGAMEEAVPDESPSTPETAAVSSTTTATNSAPSVTPAETTPITTAPVATTQSVAARKEPPEPLKPLASGAFLGGEIEIREVVGRGPINIYVGDAGDGSTSEPRLVFERASNEVVDASVESALFPPAKRFASDGREYAVYPFEMLSSFEDWNPPSDDEIYLRAMRDLSRGLLELHRAGLKPELSREGLYVSPARELRYLGFFQRPESQNESQTAWLADFSSDFSKRNLAHGATLRLDDPFAALPLSDEVKGFARALANGELPTLESVVAALELFVPVTQTQSALAGDVGMQREINEDSGLVFKVRRVGHETEIDFEVVVVADGMGGHEGGEIASKRTLDALQTAILSRPSEAWSDNTRARAAMSDIISEVNASVVEMNSNPPYAAMRHKPGATLTVGIRLGSKVILGNVGDSRAYRWNADSGLEAITKDHSYVQDLFDQGRITEEEMWGHPDGSIITSNIGMPRGLQKDVYLRLLRAGDRFLIVSDGITDMLRDPEIEEIVAAAPDAQTLAQQLTDAANEAGGADNITVAVLFCS